MRWLLLSAFSACCALTGMQAAPTPTLPDCPVTPTTEPAEDTQCPTGVDEYEKIWLDVVFVVDSSDAMDGAGLKDVGASISTAVGYTTLGDKRMASRVGVVEYAAKADVVYSFETMRNDIPITIPLMGGELTNIDSGLRLASEMLSKPSVRETRKVIVVMASTIHLGDLLDPREVAAQFKSSGGTIITVAYVQEGEAEIPLLKNISTPGFSYVVTLKSEFSPEALLDDFVELNCFCAPRLHPYRLASSVHENTPSGGCYDTVSMKANQRNAVWDCADKHGVLTTIHTDAKQEFVHSMFPASSQLWIGLMKDVNGYHWLDNSTSGYTNWVDPLAPSAGDCVTSQAAGWQTADCRKSMVYSCQMRPCSTSFDGCLDYQ